MTEGAQAAGVRLRQAVLAAGDLEAVAGQLRETLGLGEPFRDPGVGLFGLANTVFALGDCFLEVVSPTQPDTAAGRYLQRHGGDAGYMVMFDLEELERARARAGEMGIRTVWQMDLPDISGTHLHPADMSGAIVSIDSSRPYGTWRWGGPEWTGRTGSGAPGRLAGVTLAVSDPEATAARWASRAGRARRRRAGGTQLLLGGSQVAFEHAAGRRLGRADRDRRRAPGGPARGRRGGRDRRRAAARRRLVSDPAGAGAAGPPADGEELIGRLRASIRWPSRAAGGRARPAGCPTSCSTSSPRPRWRETSSRSSPTPGSWATQEMQRLARELALSETVFVLPARRGRGRPHPHLHARGRAALRRSSRRSARPCWSRSPSSGRR